MIKEYLDKIMNSEIMTKISTYISNFVNSIGSSSVKEKVDNFVNSSSTHSENANIFDGVNRRVRKFVDKKLNKKIKSTKLLDGIAKVITTIMALGFAAIVVYMMIKLLPKIIMVLAMTFAVIVTIELVLAILNRAVTPIGKTC